MSERSPSGLWRIFSPSSAGPSSSPKASPPSSSTSGLHKVVPSSSTSGSYAAVPASSGSGLHRATPARGLPSEPKGKALMLLELAAADCEKGQWASAENHLRLALTFDPRDGVVQRRLREVVETREQQRRAANAPAR
jgi:hypothetical protein